MTQPQLIKQYIFLKKIISICNNTIFNAMMVKHKGRDFELILYKLNYSFALISVNYNTIVTKEEVGADQLLLLLQLPCFANSFL